MTSTVTSVFIGGSRAISRLNETIRAQLDNLIAKLTSPKGVKGFEYYALKDKAMAQEAKCGLMLWDGESRGTLTNVLNLLGGGKKVMVYLGPEKTFYKLSNEDDLDALLNRCDPSKVHDLRGLVSPQLRL